MQHFIKSDFFVKETFNIETYSGNTFLFQTLFDIFNFNFISDWKIDKMADSYLLKAF